MDVPHRSSDRAGPSPESLLPVFQTTDIERTEDGLVSTSRIEQGTSALVNDLTRDEESYAAVRTLIGERAKTIAEQAGSGETSAEAVSKTVAERGRPDR